MMGSLKKCGEALGKQRNMKTLIGNSEFSDLSCEVVNEVGYIVVSDSRDCL